MPKIASLDTATRASMRAVILCVIGSFLGMGIAKFIAAFSAHGFHLPVGIFLFTVFTILLLDWAIRDEEPTYDPGTTFMAYVGTFIMSHWILHHFFINPAAGPFADDWWTLSNVLTNVAFGFIVPVLIGATLGITYYAARRTMEVSTWRRGWICLIAIGMPLYILARFEFMITHMMQFAS